MKWSRWWWVVYRRQRGLIAPGQVPSGFPPIFLLAIATRGPEMVRAMTLKVQWQRVGLVLLDAALVALALFAGYVLRFDFHVPVPDNRQYLLMVPVFVLVRLAMFYAFRLYRGILRYASTSELVAILLSCGAGTLVLAAANALLIPFIPELDGYPAHAGHLQQVPWSVIPIECAFSILLVGSCRFSRRLILTGIFHRTKSDDLRRVLIAGAGDVGEAVVRQMRHAIVRSYLPVAFADDDPDKKGMRIHGVPVAGTLNEIPSLIEQFEADEVLIAIPGIAPAALRDIVTHCEKGRVGFKILPSMQDVLSGRISISRIRPVEIEDLLGREEVTLELPADRNYVRGEVVMVTGAGGSIGSELCRQVLTLEPKLVLLLGHGENSIYEISTELNQTTGGDKIIPVVADIRDPGKLKAVVDAHRPAIFFHAAAHKHVPLMESHPDEAIKNNVTGTLNVALAAEAVGAKKFILISSDKAVRPTSVMGATKRMAEMMIFCLAKKSKTQFVAVRFGNVLGSRGSVIPLFRRQINRGGPVTVTHPDMVRYFMTIPEAVSLVITAGSTTEQRRLFLLDMGEPVKIADLARNLIRLSGFEPDLEIAIEFTGLRPGEKMIEELLTQGENVTTTDMGKIFCAEPDEVDCEKLWNAVSRLEEAAARTDSKAIRELLREWVPDFLG